jgi:hypothetical protein
MPIISSIGRRVARSRKPVIGGSYLYYRWRITNIRDFANSVGVQASEFVFQNSGADTRPTATVTNPGGSNPADEEPSKLYDNNTATKALDFNIKSLNVSIFLYTFSTAQTFTGYRWATANDEIGRDPITWTVEGSTNNSTWTVLHTVTNFNPTATRNTYVGPFTY